MRQPSPLEAPLKPADAADQQAFSLAEPSPGIALGFKETELAFCHSRRKYLRGPTGVAPALRTRSHHRCRRRIEYSVAF